MNIVVSLKDTATAQPINAGRARDIPNADDRVELETLGGKLFGLSA